MATILGRKTWDLCQGLEVDVDPAAGAGTPAPLGSIALAEDGSGLYVKTGAGDTAWTLAGAGGGGPQTTFVLRPGGVAGANVYTDWATLIAAHAAVEGPTIIEFDDRFGAPTITAGGPYDLRDTTCRGRMLSGTPVIVTVADGATFTILERMEWMRFDYASATPAMVVPAGLSYFRMWGSSIQNTGAAPFFDVTTPGAVFLTQFENAGGYNPLPGGTPVVDLGGTGITSFSLDEACSNGVDTVAGTPGSTVTIALRDTSGRYDPIVGPTFTGTVLGPTLVGIAANLEYDDTLATPLLSATDVQGAIDALKGFTDAVTDVDADTTIRVDNNPGADSDTITMTVGDGGNSDYDVSGPIFTASTSGIALIPPSEIAGSSPTPTFTITGAAGYYTAGDLELVGGLGDIAYGTTGGTAFLRGGTGGDAGNAIVEGGVTGDPGGNGGAVVIRASAGGTASTDGATVTIQGSQPGLAVNQAGGNVNINAGQAQGGAGGTEDCGDIDLNAPSLVGTGTAGSIRLRHGLAPLGTDGAIYIERTLGGVGDTGEMRWVENDGVENYMAIKAAQAIGSNFTLVWPDAQGGINQPMVNDGSGNLSFGPAGFIVTAIQIALYTAAFGEIVRCDPTAGGFTVNLPAITAASAGTEIVIKNVSGSTNTITISPTGDTVDGAASTTITTARGSVRLVSDGSGDWMLV